MRKVSILVTLCFALICSYAQRDVLIKGSWKFNSLVRNTALDSTRLKQIERLFRSTEMEFGADNRFTYNPQSENPLSLLSGTWQLNKEQTKISAIVSKPSAPDDKRTSEWEIIGLTDKELQLKMGNDMIVSLTRYVSAAELRKAKIKERLKKKLVFSEGLAAIGIDDNWGFIDSTGTEVIPLKYDYAENFNGGLAKVRTGKYPNYKYGFINKAGKEVVPVVYKNVGKFGEGLVPVNKGDNWGYADSTGKEVIPLEYGGTWSFMEGLAMVRNGEFMKGKCGFIDKTGRVVIPLKYSRGDEGFKNGVALVELNGRYGFIDKTGTEIIPLKYGFASSFKDELAVVMLNAKYGMIDKTDKPVIPIVYDNIGFGFTNGLISVAMNGKSGFINKKNKLVIPLKYDRARDFSEGMAAICIREKWGFINTAGVLVIPAIYESASSFSADGMASVTLNNRHFNIDRKGKEIK